MRTEPEPAELAAIPPSAWRARLERLFARDAGPALELIATTEHIFAPWGTYDLRTVPHWHSARAVIIGDAAHATSPSSGQGASMAIEDAVTLARCLRDIPESATALQSYQRLRRDRVERVVQQGRRNGSGKAIGAIVRDAMLPLVLRRFATPQSQAWMFDHRIDFDAPVDVGPVGQTDRS
ncbi:FAD-dependent monooxygenase [Skermania piniformis]|uniref:FAD-dependent monooxygenase n=2 Tax=Skermania pinensis TaxID=39122 RepID=A0ABX8SEQ7_9ACTN|nr:FAD-dependent monooxygenase [Skermania piniformis]